jgi:hypothetical protein
MPLLLMMRRTRCPRLRFNFQNKKRRGKNTCWLRTQNMRVGGMRVIPKTIKTSYLERNQSINQSIWACWALALLSRNGFASCFCALATSAHGLSVYSLG